MVRSRTLNSSTAVKPSDALIYLSSHNSVDDFNNLLLLTIKAFFHFSCLWCTTKSCFEAPIVSVTFAPFSALFEQFKNIMQMTLSYVSLLSPKNVLSYRFCRSAKALLKAG